MTDLSHQVVSSKRSDALTHAEEFNEKIEQPKLLEQEKFDFLFMSDSLYIDEKTHPDMFIFFEPIS